MRLTKALAGHWIAAKPAIERMKWAAAQFTCRGLFVRTVGLQVMFQFDRPAMSNDCEWTDFLPCLHVETFDANGVSAS